MILKVLFALCISSTSIYSKKKEYKHQDTWIDQGYLDRETNQNTQIENDRFPKLQVIDLDKLKKKRLHLVLIDYDNVKERFISFQSIDTGLNKFIEIFINKDEEENEKVRFKLVTERY